ncbi:MAG: methyltransferase domain-containing protein [Dehalococcoidales bacterium]|nr:MAG: methyltransferase domain-containing protein [Dehalococcoidales bacterium]
MAKTKNRQLFDNSAEFYNEWFTSPIGKLVLETEQELINRFVDPAPGDRVLDAGCGTGIFTIDFLKAGATVTGLDISRGMLLNAVTGLKNMPFFVIQGDIRKLPFDNDSFDKTVSITALEFIEDAQTAVNELFRVTRPDGIVVVATLNSLSPWAVRRSEKGEEHLLENAYYRSPSDLFFLAGVEGETETVVHFMNDDDPEKAIITEREGKLRKLDTGAFVAVRWQKPS